MNRASFLPGIDGHSFDDAQHSNAVAEDQHFVRPATRALPIRSPLCQQRLEGRQLPAQRGIHLPHVGGLLNGPANGVKVRPQQPLRQLAVPCEFPGVGVTVCGVGFDEVHVGGHLP